MSYNDQTVVFSGKSSVTSALGANDPQVGTRKTFDGEDYLWIYNEGSATIPVTYACSLNGSGVVGYSCNISNPTGTAQFVGMVKHTAIPTLNYGWLLTRGFATVELGPSDSMVTGQLLGVGVNGQFAFKSGSTGFPSRDVGHVLATIASGASGAAYISIY